MKYLIASVFVNTGIAKVSQQPYSMARALVLSPFVDTEASSFQSRGVGFSAVELSVNNAFATQFQNEFNRVFDGLPVEMDVSTSLDRDGRNVIFGFVKPAVAKVNEPGSPLFKTSANK